MKLRERQVRAEPPRKAAFAIAVITACSQQKLFARAG